ncbi:MAG: ABC transporter ATP-binding protein [Pseudomonadota bacterium]
MLLDVQNLSVFFNGERDKPVVDSISFSLERGRTMCLVGESGSGKTMTALSVTRLLPNNASLADTSKIVFDRGPEPSVDLNDASAETMRQFRGSDIAMIFQEPMTSLNPVLTIGDQLAEAIQHRWPELTENEINTKCRESLEKVRLDNVDERLNTYPHLLSGGQRQRVMIAMAIACEPKLLVADEPTTALDVSVQADILRLIQDLQSENGMGILFITHDLGVVAQIADTVAVMSRGQIVEKAPVRSVLKTPDHRYTQGLLDALPENLVATRSQESSPLQMPQEQLERSYIEIENLCVSFPIRSGFFRRTTGYVHALDNVSLKISRSDVVALVGESGSGKTTLGRTLLGLIAPHSGSIKLEGDDLLATKSDFPKNIRNRFQYIFQDPVSSLNPRLTIATTLIEPMGVHGIGENFDERVAIAEKLMGDLNLDEKSLWRLPYQFSGGQRQRIGIARALCVNPEFIVCDEITSALDVSVQSELLQLLLDLRESRDLTLLFISHDIGVIEYVSDYTAVMHRGEIVEFDETSMICHSPKQHYTQELLAAVPRVSALT